MLTSQKKVFHDLVADILGLAKTSVIYAQQNAPKPNKTYCTLRYYSYNQEVPSEQRHNTGVQTTHSYNTCVCEVQMFATTGIDACAELNKLVNAFDRQPIIDICKQANICVYDNERINNITALLDGQVWETRATVDLMIRFNGAVSDNVSYVDTVTMTGTTTGSITTPPTININIEGE